MTMVLKTPRSPLMCIRHREPAVLAVRGSAVREPRLFVPGGEHALLFAAVPRLLLSASSAAATSAVVSAAREKKNERKRQLEEEGEKERERERKKIRKQG